MTTPTPPGRGTVPEATGWPAAPSSTAPMAPGSYVDVEARKQASIQRQVALKEARELAQFQMGRSSHGVFDMALAIDFWYDRFVAMLSQQPPPEEG